MSRPIVRATLALTMACGFVAFEMRQRRREEERDRRREADDADFRAMIQPLMGASA